MPKPIRVALAGYGLAGKAFHAPLIAATDGLDLAVVISGDAAKIHADWPGMRVAATLDEVLIDPAIDLVVIATPDHLHHDQALAALKAGKHLVIDKPLAPTLAQAQAIAAKASLSGRIVSVFHNRRWDADFLTLRRLLAEGALGEIVEFESRFDRFRPEVTSRWKDQRAGGVWQDLGPHLIDQALVLFGMPQAIFADIAVQKAGGQAADYAQVLLRYDRLRVRLHMTQMNAAHSLRFAVHGTGGSWIKHGLDPQEAQALAGMRPSHAEWGIDPALGALTDSQLAESDVANVTGNYPAFYAALRDAIHCGGVNPVPLDQALNVMRVIAAGLLSAAERREVAL